MNNNGIAKVWDYLKNTPKVGIPLSGFVFLLFFQLIFNFFGLKEDTANIQGDTYSYFESAILLYKEYKPHPTRPFLYSFISGIPILFGIDSLLGLHRFNIILNVILWIYGLYLFGESILCICPKHKKIVWFLGLVLCTSLGSVAISGLYLTETIIGLGLIFATNVWIKSKFSTHILPTIGGILLILSLIKPSFYIPGFGLSSTMFFMWIYRRNFSIRKVSPILILGLMLFGFHLVKMKQAYNVYTPSFIDKITWYLYLGAQVEADVKNLTQKRVFDERKKELDELNERWKEKAELASYDLREKVSNNLSLVFKNLITNILDNSIGSSHALYKNNKGLRLIIGSLYSRGFNFFIIITFFSILLYSIIKQRQLLNEFWWIFLLVLYIILTSGISFNQGDRFHLIIYPLILLITGRFLSLQQTLFKFTH